MFQLLSDDLVKLKTNAELCVRRGNCYITFTNDFVVDMRNNKVAAVDQGFPGKIVKTVFRDVTGPKLESFSLDMNEGLLNVTFNEPVNTGPSSVDVTQITLQRSANVSNLADEYTLTAGTTTTSPNGRLVTLDLSLDDLHGIKATAFAKNANDTYLRLEPNALLDMSLIPNKVQRISQFNATQVSVYVPDETKVVLSCYHLDLDRSQIVLTFSEPVKPGTLNCSGLTLHSNDTSGHGIDLRLTDCVLAPGSTENGLIEITVELSQANTIAIKTDYTFGTSIEDTYLSIDSGSILDMSDIAVTKALRVPTCDHKDDKTRPSLLNFDLDIHLGVLNLTFDDVVLADTLRASAITIQNAKTASLSVDLTDSSITRSTDGYDIRVVLSHFDLIKDVYGLAISPETTFLTLRAFLIDDHAGVDVTPITDGKAKQVKSFVQDDTKPFLTDFAVDMDLGLLTLNFSDTVNLTTFAAQWITFQDNKTASSDQAKFTLTGGNSQRSLDGTGILLYLSDDDLNEIKKNTLILTDVSNTFLYLKNSTILDLARNPLIGIAETGAKQAKAFTSDLTKPELLSFDLDMNNRTLTMTFSETVEASTLDPTAITVQSRANGTAPSTLSHILIEGSGSKEDSTVLTLYLTSKDVNSLNRIRGLASSRWNTYLRVTRALVKDMNNNEVVAILEADGERVSVFTEDKISPHFLSFNLDLNSGKVRLTFDEVIDGRTFQSNELTILSEKLTNFTTSYKLTSQSQSSQEDDTIIEVTLSAGDLNEIKRRRELAIDKNTTYISIRSQAAKDMNGNNVNEIAPTAAERVANFTRDTTKPLLIDVVLDMNTGLLELRFDEVVDANLTTSRIIIQNRNTSFSSSLPLATSWTNSNDSTVLVIVLSADDLNSVKLDRTLAVRANTSFVRLEGKAVADMSGNLNDAMRNGLQVSDYAEDETRPRLLSYEMDANSGNLFLTFDEAVDSASLKAWTLTFRSAMGSNDSNSSYRLSSASGTSSPNGVLITLNISESDFNEIKKRKDLATEVNNTYISVSADFIFDMAYLEINEIKLGKIADRFVADTTSPSLRLSELDMNKGVLLLSFTETVNVSSFNADKITIQSEASNSPPAKYTLTGGTYRREDGPTIRLLLSDIDFNVIKSLDVLAISSGTTYLSFPSTAVNDMSGNPVNSLSLDQAQKAIKFVNDSTLPELLSFNLDLNRGELLITFSETIEPSSFNVTQLWLQNLAKNGTSVRRLTGSVSEFWNLVSVTVGLTDGDLNEIKLDRELTTKVNNTYLRFNKFSALDKNNNQLKELEQNLAKLVLNFTEDKTPPEITSFTLDMDHPQELLLTFDEPISSETVNISSISLQSMAEASVEDQYTLTSGTVVSNDSTEIIVRLSFFDATNLQRIPSIGTSAANSYLGIGRQGLRDMNDNSIDAILNGSYVKAQDFVPDTTRPFLTNFTLDMNTGRLSLTFSETVRVSSVLVTEISIQRAVGPLTRIPGLTLRGGTVSSQDSYIVHIDFTKADFDKLKEETNRDLATNIDTTYISYSDSATVLDMVGNRVVEIQPGDAKKAAQYIADQSPPVLLEFDFNMASEGLLNLTFTETMDVSTINATGFEFRNAELRKDSTRIVQLTSVTALDPSVDGVEFQVIVSENDMNELKKYTDLGTDANNTYLFLYDRALEDMAGNDVSEEGGVAVKVTNYAKDVTRPKLSEFGLDMNTGILALTFSETVNASSLAVSGVTLVPSQGANSSIHKIRAGVLTELHDSPTIRINLSISDVNDIKRLTALASSSDNAYISITNWTIADMVGLPVERLEISDARVVTKENFVLDTTSPVFQAFSLDIDSGVLTFTFDETVDVQTLGLTTKKITLLSDANRTTSYTLSGGELLDDDDPTVRVQLSKIDHDFIRLDTDLATGYDNTLLLLEDNGIQDMAGNSVDETLRSVQLFTGDSSSPNLESFSMDLDLGILSLNFDEPVDVESMAFTNITLQSSETGGTSYTLTGGSTNSSDGLTIDVILTIHDLNNVKRNTTLFVDRNSTFLSVAPTLVKDMAGNLLNRINETSALPVEQFFFDTTRPRLRSFDLDMNTGKLTLYFRETIDVSTTNVTAITLQLASRVNSTSQQYRLKDRQLIASTDSTSVQLQLSLDDLNEIKARGIALRRLATALLIDEFAVKDMNEQPVLPRYNGNAITVATFVNDLTRPSLQEFDLNITSEELILSFSETVDASTVNVSDFVLQNAQTTPTEVVRLSAGSKPSLADGPKIVIKLSTDDLNELKKMTRLAVSSSTTWLSVSQLGAKDAFGNQLLPVPSLPVSNFTLDSIRPRLLTFSLDMNEGLITLSFSETVNITSLNMTEVTLLQNATSDDNVTSFVFSGGDVITNDSDIVIVKIISRDLNAIKKDVNLATGASNETTNSYLSITARAITDMNGNQVYAVAKSNALAARPFVSDVTLPELVEYTLDLNLGLLKFLFSETVNASSLQVTEIVLRNQSIGSLVTYRLTGGSVVSDDGTLVQVNISTADLNEIKRLSGLATTENTTFLSLSGDFVRDMADNFISQISVNASKQVNRYIEDKVPPVLTSFDIDMDAGSLAMTFSETVKASTFTPAAITIRNAPMATGPDNTYVLTGGSSSLEDGTVITLNLSTSDLNNLKACPTLAISINTTFIAMTNMGIKDMNENPVVPLSKGKKANDYVFDESRPDLVSFNVDMDIGKIFFTFSEIVNKTTFKLDEFVFQDSITPANVTYNMTGV